VTESVRTSLKNEWLLARKCPRVLLLFHVTWRRWKALKGGRKPLQRVIVLRGKGGEKCILRHLVDAQARSRKIMRGELSKKNVGGEGEEAAETVIWPKMLMKRLNDTRRDGRKGTA